MKFSRSAGMFTLLLVVLALPRPAVGHGFAGARFFPATLSTDDPFVNDELSFPTVSTIKTSEGRETDISVEISKRITPNIAIEAGESFRDLNPKHGPETSGSGNLELAAKYEFFVSEAHETILSVGAGVEIGGTGQRQGGAETFSTWTSEVFLVKASAT